jgi:hypothetical protein
MHIGQTTIAIKKVDFFGLISISSIINPSPNDFCYNHWIVTAAKRPRNDDEIYLYSSFNNHSKKSS